MPLLETEREHLAHADRDIAAGERRVCEQKMMLEWLRSAGHDTRGAEWLLLNLQQTLQAWRDHREAILLAIARLERLPT